MAEPLSLVAYVVMLGVSMALVLFAPTRRR
jgi:hypothetical protein